MSTLATPMAGPSLMLPAGVNRLGYALLFFGLAFCSGQRFLLPYLSAYACLVPLLLLVLLQPPPALRNALVVMALLVKVDLGDTAYMETFNVVRFAIYVCAIFVLAGRVHNDFAKTRYLLAFTGALAILTMFNTSGIDPYTMMRDCLTVILVFLVVLCSGQSREVVMSFAALNCFALGLLCSEFVNILFFYQKLSGHYLSYDSLKCVLAFSSIYYLIKRQRIVALVLIGLTTYVFVQYSARTLILSYIVLLLMIYMSMAHGAWKKIQALLVLLGIGGGALMLLSNYSLESNRVFSVVLLWMDAGDFYDYFRLLDPVRSTEHGLFFERSWFHILFGDGLGSGLVDTGGRLAFVKFDAGAFSDKEINEGVFYRLHDSWIYIGLRFGLVSVVLVNWFFARAIFSRVPERMVLGSLGLLLLNNAAFSIPGLLMIALVAKQMVRLDAAGAPTHSPRP